MGSATATLVQYLHKALSPTSSLLTKYFHVILYSINSSSFQYSSPSLSFYINSHSYSHCLRITCLHIIIRPKHLNLSHFINNWCHSYIIPNELISYSVLPNSLDTQYIHLIFLPFSFLTSDTNHPLYLIFFIVHCPNIPIHGTLLSLCGWPQNCFIESTF